LTVQFTTLFSFNGSDGNDPEAELTVDASGNLFGTTYLGGPDGDGTVFEMKNTGTVAAPAYASGLTTLVTDGASPHAGLIADANGDLFATSTVGGGAGTVFEIKNTGTIAAPVYASAPTTLVSFNGSNGADPYAGLISDPNGDLFGTTKQGGAYGNGTVFEIKNTGTVAAPGAPGTSSTTRFTLSDQSSAGGAPVVDNTTTVIDRDRVSDAPPVTVNAYNGYNLNMLSLNLSNEAQYGVARYVNSNLNVNGAIYPSAYSVEMNINGTLYGDTFAGSFSTDASGVVTGGSVSAYFEYVSTGSSWVLANSVTGLTYSAVSFYDAALSGLQSDTNWIGLNVLSGNDLINDSTGNDVLYAGWVTTLLMAVVELTPRCTWIILPTIRSSGKLTEVLQL
jgi:uncharacterized repeat protein (TIGR03803 family)